MRPVFPVRCDLLYGARVLAPAPLVVMAIADAVYNTCRVCGGETDGAGVCDDCVAEGNAKEGSR